MQHLFWHGSPRYRSFDELIEDDSDCPNITADTIDVVLECLWRHIDGTAYVVVLVLLKLTYWNSKSEISVLVKPIFMENVGRFDVSMHEASSVDIVVSFDELLEYLYWLKIGHCFALFDEIRKVSFTKFSDEVGIIFCGIDVIEMENVWPSCKCFENCDLKL